MRRYCRRTGPSRRKAWRIAAVQVKDRRELWHPQLPPVDITAPLKKTVLKHGLDATSRAVKSRYRSLNKFIHHSDEVWHLFHVWCSRSERKKEIVADALSVQKNAYSNSFRKDSEKLMKEFCRRWHGVDAKGKRLRGKSGSLL